MQKSITAKSPLKRYALRFGIGALLGGLLGICIALVAPKQWRATLLLQVAQVGDSTTPVLALENVAQRIRFPGFIPQVLEVLKLPKDLALDNRSELIRDTLQARIERNGNLIELSVQGFSQAEAKMFLEAALQVIKVEHALLLSPSERRLRDHLNAVVASLVRLQDEREKLHEEGEKYNGTDKDTKNFSQSVLLANLIRSSETEARRLHDQRLLLEEQLSPYRTFNTKAVTQTYVPDRPNFPRKIVFLVVGVLAGLLTTFIYSLLTDPLVKQAIGEKIFDNR